MNCVLLIKLLIGVSSFLQLEAKINSMFTKIECINQWPELLSSLNCTLKRPPSGDGRSFSIEFILSENVKEVSGLYIIGIQRGKTITNYTALEMNYCTALGTLQNNHLLKMVADELRRVGNFPLQCPFKKNKRYYLKDYKFDGKLLPSYTPELNFKTDCVISTQKRTAFRFTTQGRLFKSGKL